MIENTNNQYSNICTCTTSSCTLSNCRTKWEYLQIDTTCVLIWLCFLDSNHLNWTVRILTIRSGFNTLEQKVSETIQYLLSEVHTFVLALTITIYILLERYSSTFIIFHSRNLTAMCCLNIWLTCQLLTSFHSWSFMCGVGIHAPPTHILFL